MLDHRYLGVAADALDQALATARHDHVDELRHGDQLTDGSAVGSFHHLHGSCRQIGHGQALLDTAGNRLIGMDGLGAATQDGGVAGLQAQAGRIDGHVRPRLVDDADHAQRHTHFADLDTGRQVAHALNLADRVRQGRHLAQAFDHAVDHLRRQRQAVDHGRLQTAGAGGSQVQFVGGGQLGAGGVEGIGSGLQRAILLRGAGTGEHPGGLAGGLAQAGHVVVHGLGHGGGGLAVGKMG